MEVLNEFKQILDRWSARTLTLEDAWTELRSCFEKFDELHLIKDMKNPYVNVSQNIVQHESTTYEPESITLKCGNVEITSPGTAKGSKCLIDGIEQENLTAIRLDIDCKASLPKLVLERIIRPVRKDGLTQ